MFRIEISHFSARIFHYFWSFYRPNTHKVMEKLTFLKIGRKRECFFDIFLYKNYKYFDTFIEQSFGFFCITNVKHREKNVTRCNEMKLSRWRNKKYQKTKPDEWEWKWAKQWYSPGKHTFTCAHSDSELGKINSSWINLNGSNKAVN